MIDLSEVVSDEELAQPFVVERAPVGGFANEGQWTPASGPAQLLNALGVVTALSAADATAFLPEGERARRGIKVYTATPIYMSDGRYDPAAATQGSSGFGDAGYGDTNFGGTVGTQADVLQWQGSRFRVAFSKPYQTYGYYLVMATFIGYTESA